MQGNELKLFELLFERSFIYREDPPFKLVSGKESFYYYDCKATTLNQEGLSLVGKVLFYKLKEIIADEEIEGLGGLTLGADPMKGLPLVQLLYEKRQRSTELKNGLREMWQM